MATIQHILPLLLLLPLIAARRTNHELNSNDKETSDFRRAFSEYLRSSVQERSPGWQDPCRWNLGGLCSSEEAMRVAEAWRYLNSGEGPGRKRREVRATLMTMLRRSPNGMGMPRRSAD